MGIFSGKDVLHAETLSAKLFPEEADPIKKATITAILTDNDIRDYQHAAYLSSFELNADKYLDYGRDHYLLGLPEGKVGALGVDPAIAQPIVAGVAGEPVTVTGGFIGEPVLAYFVYEQMQIRLGWDFATNETHLIMVGGGAYPLSLTTYSVAGGNILATLKATATLAAIHGSLTFNAPLGPAPNPTGTYVHVQYYLNSEGSGSPRYWTYDTAKKTYPALDQIAEGGTDIGGDFYPIVPIRIDQDFIFTSGYEKGRKGLSESAKKMMKKLFMKPEDLVEALKGPKKQYDDHGNVTNDSDLNKDLDKMDDTYFMFALDIYTLVEPSIEYFFNFFGVLALTSPTNKLMFEQMLKGLQDEADKPSAVIDTEGVPSYTPKLNNTVPKNTFYLKEGNDFQMQVSFNYITTSVVNGVLANKFERSIVILAPHTISSNNGYDENHLQVTQDQEFERSTITFKKRLTPTTYSEVTVHGLIHKTRVDKKGKAKIITRALEQEKVDEAEKNRGEYRGDSAFFIPLAWEVIDSIHDRIDREIILYDSVQLVIMAAVIEHIPFYKTGIFRILLTIVIFVISVLVLMFGPQNLTLVAAMWSTFSAMMIAFALSIVIDLVFKYIGGDLALVIAAILTIIVAWQTGQFNFDVLAGPNMVHTVWAVTGHVSNLLGLYQTSEMYALQAEYEDMLKDQEEQQEELDEAYDLLSSANPAYDPLFIVHNTSMISMNESADQFLRRTTITNPGRESLKMIENFVEDSLKLPTPDYMNQFEPVV